MSDFFVYFLLSLPLIGAYAMLAIGIVVVFRASKVLNLAHGAMAMLPAYATFELNQRGVPMLFAVPLGVAVGAGLGTLVERFFVRPLAAQGPTAQTVGTVAVYGLVVAAVAQVWGSGSKQAPAVFPDGGVHVVGALLRWGQLGLFFVALLCAAGFFALFRYTGIGLAMRGAAENPRAAGLMGINPERMARLAWMLGGGLAGLAGILLAAVTNLQPYSLSLQMLPAFVAALLGGLTSLPGAVIGAAVVGAAQGMVPAFRLIPGLEGLASQVGMPQLVLTVLALVTMYFRGVRFAGGDSRAALAGADVDSARQSAFDDHLVGPPRGRRRALRYVLLVVLVSWPFVGIPSFLRPLDTFSVLGDAILAAEYFMIAASIVLLTGWVGQISLSQGAFVGVAAFGSALLTRHLGMEFPYSLLPSALLAAGASGLLGVVALRVRGLYLAVATLIFAWMADEYLFVVPWFAGRGGTATVETDPVGVAGGFPFFDFRERRTFYFVVLTAAAAVLFGLLNMRDSKAGRAFSAVRGSEMAAASLGIDVVRYKLMAFAAAGFVAGVAGNLILTHHVTVVPAQFSLQASLLFLAIAVVGGLRSLGGAVAASIVFAGLSEVFFRVPALGEYLQLVSALLLALILLVYPGGLAALPGSVRRLVAKGRATPQGEALARRVERLRPVVGRATERARARLRAGAEGVAEWRRRLPEQMWIKAPPGRWATRRTAATARRTALVLPTGRFAGPAGSNR
jgi:branched-chain amino acid transport system permease protein